MKDKFTKALNSIARFSSFIVIAVSMLLYILFATLQIEGGILEFFTDTTNVFWLVLNTGITIFLHQIVISTATDNATSFGLDSPEFIKADELNAIIINTIGSDFNNFIIFIKDLNTFEKKTIELGFIQSCGKLSVDELDEKELKAFKKLKPIIHDISNFLRPCYVEIGKNKKISYDASYTANKRNLSKRISKMVFSLLFAFVTLGPIIFSIGDFGMAMLSATVTTLALLLTFITVFIPIYYKLRYSIPKKVYNKGVLVNTYKEKNKSIKLDLQKFKGLEGKKDLQVLEDKLQDNKLPDLTTVHTGGDKEEVYNEKTNSQAANETI